jgi:hypothetical protein
VWQSIFIAAIGGILVLGAELLEVRNTPKDQRPDFKDMWHWFPFFFNPLSGGFLAWVYEASATPLTPLLALNVGAAAPLIIRSLAEANPFRGPADAPPGA